MIKKSFFGQIYLLTSFFLAHCYQYYRPIWSILLFPADNVLSAIRARKRRFSFHICRTACNCKVIHNYHALNISKIIYSTCTDIILGNGLNFSKIIFDPSCWLYHFFLRVLALNHIESFGFVLLRLNSDIWFHFIDNFFHCGSSFHCWLFCNVGIIQELLQLCSSPSSKISKVAI